MTILKRRDLWATPYHDLIDTIRRREFSWEEHECVTGLCGPVVEVLTGVDLYSEYRGRYKDAEGALALMRDLGFDDLADLAASRLPEIHPARAEIGDIAAIPVDTPFRHALGVVNGERILVLSADRALAHVDRRRAARAFKVG